LFLHQNTHGFLVVKYYYFMHVLLLAYPLG
jgi:hypothetical protein